MEPGFLLDLSSPNSNLNGLLTIFLQLLSFKALVGPSSSLKSIKANPLHLPVSSKVAILILIISPQCWKCSVSDSLVVSNDKLPTNKIRDGGFLDNGAPSSLAGLPSKESEFLINKFLPFNWDSDKEITVSLWAAVVKSM
ncbi:hypothetical protein WICPIJ_001185 [Wickerhamomyces pijperi]|uniref:Uncharacterized protein n=1 Tax=Wickerhamomyces pijperi TaxID=599730 RepID=A0A9P8QDT6_WICPI|nr:hypothetical protein WICPIJ_001185 [Wickerhamomyces pijperi]